MSKPTPDPSDIVRECLAVRIRLINRAVSRIYNEALRPCGFTVAQMNVLVAITQLDAPTQAMLSRVLHIEKSTVTRDVQRLEDLGWIRTAIDRAARRQTLVLTARGQKKLDEAGPAWQSAQAETRTALGRAGVAAVHQAFQSLCPAEFTFG